MARDGLSAEHLGFWKSMIDGAPPPATLPGQEPAAGLDDFAGWARPVRLTGPDAGTLRRAAGARAATLHALTLSCFVRALARSLSTTDLTIGVLVSRRGVDVDADAVGEFVTVLPVRFRLPDGLDPVACLDTVTEQIRLVQRHSATDPAEILDVVRAQRGGQGSSFHIAFAWEDETPEPRFAGLTASWSLLFNGWSEYDLTVELADHGDVVAGQVVGKQATSARVDVDGLMRQVSACVAELATALAPEGDRS
jgi:non-ribosomal peptide synthetase component F